MRQYEKIFGNINFRELLSVHVFTYKISQIVFPNASYSSCFEKMLLKVHVYAHRIKKNTQKKICIKNISLKIQEQKNGTHFLKS